MLKEIGSVIATAKKIGSGKQVSVTASSSHEEEPPLEKEKGKKVPLEEIPPLPKEGKKLRGPGTDPFEKPVSPLPPKSQDFNPFKKEPVTTFAPEQKNEKNEDPFGLKEQETPPSKGIPKKGLTEPSDSVKKKNIFDK